MVIPLPSLLLVKVVDFERGAGCYGAGHQRQRRQDYARQVRADVQIRSGTGPEKRTVWYGAQGLNSSLKHRW